MSRCLLCIILISQIKKNIHLKRRKLIDISIILCTTAISDRRHQANAYTQEYTHVRHQAVAIKADGLPVGTKQRLLA